MSEFIGTKLTMNLGERSYDIIIKSGSLENLYQFARLDRRVAVVTDSGVPAQYAQRVADQCKDARIITVPQGEASKSFKILESVLRQMLDFGMGRGDLVVAVGGGVVGDLAGFAASIYMRGIDFINCPTTTLSMIDSSIGGKTAVDLGDTKNIVGAFWQPKLVIVDPDTLSTLPRRHYINGLAEAVKASLLADPELFAIFEKGDIDAQIGEYAQGTELRPHHRPRHRGGEGHQGPPHRGPVPRRVRSAGHAAHDRVQGPAEAGACGVPPPWPACAHHLQQGKSAGRDAARQKGPGRPDHGDQGAGSGLLAGRDHPRGGAAPPAGHGGLTP